MWGWNVHIADYKDAIGICLRSRIRQGTAERTVLTAIDASTVRTSAKYPSHFSRPPVMKDGRCASVELIRRSIGPIYLAALCCTRFSESGLESGSGLPLLTPAGC